MVGAAAGSGSFVIARLGERQCNGSAMADKTRASVNKIPSQMQTERIVFMNVSYSHL